MAMMRIEDLGGIAPASKQVTFKAEKNGEPVEVTLYIYPYTVKDKIEIKELNKKAKSLDKNSDEYLKFNEEITQQIVYMILKKSIEGLSLSDIKDGRIPQIWFEDIIRTCLEFDGITKEKFNEIRKNQIDSLLQTEKLKN